MFALFGLLMIFVFLTGLLALFVHFVRKFNSKFNSDMSTMPLNKANLADEDEHALKGVSSGRMFNIDGSLMVNSMIDSRGKPFGQV